MIQIKSKLDCCGCTACASSCSKSAITMVPDEEGFLYPKIDMRRCIECGACERACPILNKKTVISEKTEGYIIRIKDNKILYESTSGGAFTALADYILEQNGIVYGAGYDNNMRVVCKRATTKQQLQEMRGSKFVQSDLGNIFQDIKKELKEGTTILFSGTPCQVAGLLSFLRKKPDNLLCVDFVCRGVPSPGLWDNYVKYMENKYSSKIVGARFKHKTYGYHTSTMKIDFANGKTYYGSGRVDPYMKAFVREISSRPSCAACAFKGIERPSDITVFDCYEYSKITGRKDDNRGYSSIFVHTEKGGKILEAIKSHIEIQEEDVNSLVTENGVMVCNSAKPHPRRAEFYQLAEHYPIDKALNKIDPITLKDKIIEKMLEVVFPRKACVNLFYNNDYKHAYLVCSNSLEYIRQTFKSNDNRGVKFDFYRDYPDYIHEAVENKKIDEMYRGTANTVNGCLFYWLGDAADGDKVMVVYTEGLIYDFTYVYSYFGVRPVITVLKSKL